MLQLGEFVNRENFGPWLEARFPGGKGVEIGIDQADFAHHVLTGWKSCGAYWAIDPWITGYDPNDPVSNRKGYEQVRAERWARETLGKFPCVEVLKMSSRQAAAMTDPCSVDFVYIDGDHTERSVCFDLGAWWEKLMPGGVLAGHDFITPGRPTVSGVIQSEVMQFASFHKREVFLVTEEDRNRPWSWCVVK
jgi:hypothetical protein